MTSPVRCVVPLPAPPLFLFPFAEGAEEPAIAVGSIPDPRLGRGYLAPHCSAPRASPHPPGGFTKTWWSPARGRRELPVELRSGGWTFFKADSVPARKVGPEGATYTLYNLARLFIRL